MHLAGSAIRVPVMAPPETNVLRQREFEIQLQASGAQIESAAMTENAMAELANVGCGPNPLSHDLFGDFAVQAQAQGMVGSSTGQLLPPCERQAPVASSNSLGSLGLFNTHAPADKSADPGQQPIVRKRRGSAALADCTGQLKVTRQAGLDLGKSLQDDFTGRQHLGKVLKAAYKKAGESLPANMSMLCEKYDDIIAQITSEIKR